MAQATRQETWDVSVEKIWNVITDYQSYAEFVDGVSAVEVLEQDESGARVKFSLNLIKKFSYILKLKHEPHTKISWSFETGDIFKKNEGSWQFKDLGDGKTQIDYALEVDIKGFVPKAIVNSLTSKNLPAMMDSYQNRAKNSH
tara:strand:+ start:106489 stop:106917 length:429 start_codon:yes stop_codon:yes gene_type:complete